MCTCGWIVGHRCGAKMDVVHKDIVDEICRSWHIGIALRLSAFHGQQMTVRDRSCGAAQRGLEVFDWHSIRATVA